MTALAANVNRPYRMPPGGLRLEKLPLAGYTNFGAGTVSHTVYKGSIMSSDVSDTDGYFAAQHTTAGSGDVFGGISMEKQVVGSADLADGAIQCSVALNGVWAFAKGGLAQTDVGAIAYAADDNAITSASTGAIPIGIIELVDSTYAWVNIEDYAMKPMA